MDATSYGVACRELEAGGLGACGASCRWQGSLAMFPIHAYGSDEQKEEWLPRLATGEAVGCFGRHRGGLRLGPGGDAHACTA